MRRFFDVAHATAWRTIHNFITNPAYNADRGPVHIFSGRLHGEF